MTATSGKLKRTKLLTLKGSATLKEKPLITVGIKPLKLVNKFIWNNEENIASKWGIFDSVGVKYYTSGFQ